jgi:hypothetical protein
MKKHYRQENDCLNCGTVLEGKYCHNCGQENLELKESFGHMMNHAISDYFHFDHQFFHTLKPLLFKPGFLTNEYMNGRRAQYLHPVKMYIFISIVYFLLLFNTGHDNDFIKLNEDGKVPAATSKHIDSLKQALAKDHNLSSAQKTKIVNDEIKHQADLKAHTQTDTVNKNFKSGLLIITADTSYKQYIAKQQKLPESKQDGWFAKLYNKKAFDYKTRYGTRSKEVFYEEVRHNIPKMMFLILPLFALILRFTFWRNKKFYVEHLIFAFHLHCFFFMFLAILMLLLKVTPENETWMGIINFAGGIYILWYTYKALKVVYQRSTFRTITKFIGMYISYMVVFVFCFTLVLIISALLL